MVALLRPQQVPLLLVSALSFVSFFAAYAQDLDQFTYQDTTTTSPNPQYAPQDWSKVRCGNLQTCTGWPEKYLPSIGWKLHENDCQSCPASGNSCGIHHQSPISLERDRAINSSIHHNQCVDVHLMKYHDSSCTFDELVAAQAFKIERHALQIIQPIELYNGAYRLACVGGASQNRFAKIDFSRGFLYWWHLSHIDFKVSRW
jgi:hypothetical protein